MRLTHRPIRRPAAVLPLVTIGLVGLLGLAGLFGLKRRDHDRSDYREHRMREGASR